MAIETTANRVSYAGNGVTTGFSFPYKFLANADLVVISRDNLTGVETVKTLTTHYTVSGAGGDSGGTVTMLVAPAAGTTLVIYNDPAATQGVDLAENDSLPAEIVEGAFDRLTILVQRLKDRVSRTIGLSDGFSLTFDPTLPSDLDAAGGKLPRINDAGTGFAPAADWPDATGVTDEMTAIAAAAAASASAAATSQGAAATSATNAATSATNSQTSATNSQTSATNSSNSATAAAASALAAQNAAAANLWRDVVFLTFADSPRTILSSERNKLFAVDTSGGNVVINLPQISALDLATPFALGFKKTSTDGNSITINRAGTDQIDGATSKTISVASGGSTLIPDTDPSPDQWTAADFGASAGNLTRDKFSGTGAQTAFTLSVNPGAKNNTFVYVEGIYQAKDTYTLSGTTLTFSEAPPSGTDNIEVISGTLLSIGTPSDGTVTTAKVVDGAITSAKIGGTSPTIQKFTAGSGTYTTPAGVKWIRVRMVGGGGGGGGSGTTTTAGNGNAATASTASTFGTSLLSAGAGGAGLGGRTNGVAGGSGGTASLGTGPVGLALDGAIGGYGGGVSTNTTESMGGSGANSAFGGGGAAGGGGTKGAVANTGAGGGGAGNTQNASVFCGSGGGAGAFIDAIITSPLASYAYAVGVGGSPGASGTTGAAGGAGAAGIIIVEEHYH